MDSRWPPAPARCYRCDFASCVRRPLSAHRIGIQRADAASRCRVRPGALSGFRGRVPDLSAVDDAHNEAVRVTGLRSGRARADQFEPGDRGIVEASDVDADLASWGCRSVDRSRAGRVSVTRDRGTTDLYNTGIGGDVHL